MSSEESATEEWPPRGPSYRLTAFVMLRLLGFVYFAAFVSLAGQVIPLVGRDGLLPAVDYLERVRLVLGSGWSSVWRVPTIFWIDASDGLLVSLAWLGAAISFLVMIGFADAIAMGLLWALYTSFVQIGQVWYGYGWEIQLLETGFLAIFLCPLFDPRPFASSPPPRALMVLFRWLIVRIMLGAGLIKLRGDACWRDLTCLYYHYETQPIPGILSRLLHNAPRWFHQGSVAFNHLVELVAPLFAFAPRIGRLAAGGLFVAFQLLLVVSGNLSFLNWLTIVPALACFDDDLWSRILPAPLVRLARLTEGTEISRRKRVAVHVLVAVVAVLSIQPIVNLLSREQIMDTSFEPFALVNTYGAFGTVTRERNEIVFEGTRDVPITEESRWSSYELPCKPGDPMRRPCFSDSFHHRLDWQMWFAAMSDLEQEPWAAHLAWKLLQGDAAALSLFETNPFPDAPPAAIRIRLYRYAFAPIGAEDGAFWTRVLLGDWLRPVTRDDAVFLDFLTANGWSH